MGQDLSLKLMGGPVENCSGRVLKRPPATLKKKKLQQFLTGTGCSLHVTTISQTLHASWQNHKIFRLWLKKLKMKRNFTLTAR